MVALAFLLPNLIGFLVFTAGPVLLSLWMSFTDVALTKHNRFSDTPIRFVGVENYQRLLVGDESRLFWDYFGNTAFLMLGIPLGIAGSLALALMLTSKSGPTRVATRSSAVVLASVASIVACVGVWVVMTPGPPPAPGSSAAMVMSGETGLTDLPAWTVANARATAAVLAVATAGLVVVLGLAAGQVFFRTVFYLPSLLAGVAMFLLWKTLYRPRGGLINAGLSPLIEWVEWLVLATPPGLWTVMAWVAGVGLALLAAGIVARGLANLSSGEAGFGALLGRVLIAVTVAAVAVGAWRVLGQLPAWASSEGGLKAPDWLIDSRWAKTALIIMGVWCAVGGGNMLLYLAGLSNIPPELYEAASIDGATAWQRFKHVTWPQLAPTTFFIVIMSTIGGLQGGFEQAMVMTQGKADTIVLAYYLYNIAFTDQFQLGLASAIAWVMFAMIFVMTAVNFRVGSRLTNE